MSKNIAIQEGDNPKVFNNVKKIIIKNVDGSNSYWVPEDDRKVGTKHITENGTYKASEEKDEGGVSKGWYGYSEVTVSGIGVASGINPETGNEGIVKPDSDGNLPDTPVDVPSSIKIIGLPHKMAYRDGEPINISGIGVRAYMRANDGNAPWAGDETHPDGLIPLEELEWEPEKAKFEGDEGDEWEDGDIVALRIHVGEPKMTNPYSGNSKYTKTDTYLGLTHSTDMYGEHDYYQYLANTAWNGEGEGYIYLTRYNGKIYGVSGNLSMRPYSSTMEDGSRLYGWGSGNGGISAGTVFNSSVAETSTLYNEILNSIPESSVNPQGKDFSHSEKVRVRQYVTIKWKRVGDGKELTAKYEVVVVPEKYEPPTNDEND